MTTYSAAPDGQEDICNDPDVFFCENWESRAAGNSDFSSPRFKSPGWANSSLSTQSIATSEKYSGTKAFEFKYPQGNNTGAGFMTVDWPGGPHRTVYYRWMVKYSQNFVWSAVATKHDEFYFSGTGARTPQLMWYPGSGAQVTQRNTPMIFLYASSAGDNHAFDQNENLPPSQVNVGQWYCMEVKITMNSSNTTSDGSFEGWIDGVRKFNRQNIIVDNQGETKIKGLLMSSYWNCYQGGDSCTGGAIDTHPLMYRWEDNHVAATKRIGCPGVTPTPAPSAPAAPKNLKVL